MAKRARCPAEKPMIAGSIPGGGIYFHFDFAFSFLTARWSPLQNEIKHDISPVVIVVLDHRYD